MYETEDFREDEEPADFRPEEGWFSIYTLPPVMAGLISLILMVVMLNFGYRQISDTDLSQFSLTTFNEPADPLGDDSAPGGIAPLFAPAVQYWSPSILRWSQKWELDPNLIATVMQIESCGHPSIQSSAGATGLFQVMPFHFKAGEDATDPETNALRGMAYLRQSLAAHDGDVYGGLAGYNAGIGGSQQAEAAWPAETQQYVYWGIGIYNDARDGEAKSNRLNEWLESGGASLCRKASQTLGIAP